MNWFLKNAKTFSLGLSVSVSLFSTHPKNEIPWKTFFSRDDYDEYIEKKFKNWGFFFYFVSSKDFRKAKPFLCVFFFSLFRSILKSKEREDERKKKTRTILRDGETGARVFVWKVKEWGMSALSAYIGANACKILQYRW